MIARGTRRRWIRTLVRELSIIEYRSDPKEVKENVLFILRRGCHGSVDLL